MRFRDSALILLILSGALVLSVAAPTRPLAAQGEVTLLNVSYDPTRELYQELNAGFAKYWKGKAGQTVTVRQSHGGSGKQARSVIDGLEADVVTLALGYDIDALHQQAKLIPANWQTRLPNNSAPYTSTIVFVVRKGNPKGIKDWDDLVKPGVSVITPNPKTSGGARWNYLAAWGYALRQSKGDEGKARDFVARLYKNVPVLDSGARGSTTTFRSAGWRRDDRVGERGLPRGKELGPDKLAIVVPSVSILAEPPVTIVDKTVTSGARGRWPRRTSSTCTARTGRESRRSLLPPAVGQGGEQARWRLPQGEPVTIDEVFGGWVKAQPHALRDGGIFDEIYQPK